MAETSKQVSHALQTALEPGLCLALMFAGIWLSDNAMLSLAEPPGGSLAMRVISLAAYAVALALATCLPRFRRADNLSNLQAKRTLALLVGGGCVLFALGAVGAASAPSISGGALALVLLALTKCIGPFLSVVVLLRFASLTPRATTKASALGMIGAFILKQLVELAAAPLGWNETVLLGFGAAFLAAANIVTIAFLLRASEPPTRVNPLAQTDDRASMHRKTTDKKFVAGLIVAAMMLGFLHAGNPTDAAATPATTCALVLMALAIGRFSSFDGRELFRAALVCTAAGFLLAPLLSLLADDADLLLVSMGTTLFEIVIWNASAVAIRSHENPLRAAVGARLAVAAGHLAGTLVAAAAGALAGTYPQAEQAASLVIVFADMIMLLYLFSNPTSHLPFPFRIEDTSAPQGDESPATTNAENPPTATANAAMRTSEQSPASTDDKSPGSLDNYYWKEPCAVLAAQHQLTPRETDVLEQLAQGRDLAYMENLFVLSRNTIKMHIRHVYGKLDVHSKQDLINLVEATRENA